MNEKRIAEVRSVLARDSITWMPLAVASTIEQLICEHEHCLQLISSLAGSYTSDEKPVAYDVLVATTDRWILRARELWAKVEAGDED